MIRKKLILLMAIAAVAMFGSCSSDNAEDLAQDDTTDEAVVLTKEIETRAIEQANNFSYNLFTAVTDDLSQLENKNIFISPLSVSMALSMTANGAVGETRQQIINALGYKDVTTIDGINQVNAKLLAELPNVDPQVKLTIANALWVNETFPIKNTFTTKLNDTYQATVENLDFSDIKSVGIINDWANVNTNGLIKSIINSIDPSMAIILANALYFKADWSQPAFETSDNFKFNSYTGKQAVVESFTKYESDIAYNRNEKCQIATFPLAGGNYTYTAILPNENISISDAVNSVTDAFLNGASREIVRFESPIFEYKNSLKLKDYLKLLGISDIFDSNKADFSKIADQDIFLSMIKHDACISLNGTGIEAAAVTYVGIDGSNGGGSSTTPQYKKIILDRPFAFIIRETTTNVIVFIGAVNEL